ncbi:DUF2076 family protein [Lentzea flava]|uniref:DUF2076 domain-containing protein n=1 Tax=Lentzea flava TaxID=103732 RepID=A0ABQ2VDS7_9PSEU|nr:DUF2076 family protein [Lentzea flava]MCP2204520.1 hypothetical protein [Lentzea flava]GGU78161.1 hypothetical protein GCM10010178_81460 [Lentzea flava]
MDHQDRELILGLANRLRQAPAVPQDPQAAELIAQQIASQPNSVYLLVQAVLVQEDALRQAQAKIAAMGSAGQNPAFTQPGFTPAPNPAFSSVPGYGQQPQGGFRSGMFGQQQQQQGGGGFLKTAAAAAAGVAGGALLVAGAQELFSDDQPQAQQQAGGEDDGFSFTDLF